MSRFEKEIVIDGKGHLMGRLASLVAKQLLNGFHVTVVRCEEINIAGPFFRNKRESFIVLIVLIFNLIFVLSIISSNLAVPLLLVLNLQLAIARQSDTWPF